MLKGDYATAYHTWALNHLHRFVSEFAGRHNIRNGDTVDRWA